MGTEPNLNNVVSPPRKTNKNRPYRIPQKKDLRKRLPLGYQCGGTRGLQMLFKFKLSMTYVRPPLFRRRVFSLPRRFFPVTVVLLAIPLFRW